MEFLVAWRVENSVALVSRFQLSCAAGQRHPFTGGKVGMAPLAFN